MDLDTLFASPQVAWSGEEELFAWDNFEEMLEVDLELFADATTFQLLGEASVTLDDSTSSTASDSDDQARGEIALRGKPRKNMTKKPRTNMRNELIHLRSTVFELENKLTEVRQEVIESGRGPSADILLLRDVWEGMATRQLVQREAAESENATLRKLLEEQLTVARSLEQLLRKRQYMELIASAEPSIRRRMPPAAHSTMNHDAVVEDLLASLLVMYTQVDEVMCDPRFHVDFPRPHRDIRLTTEETGTAVKIVEFRALPFDYKRTADALWNISLSREHNAFAWQMNSTEILTVNDDLLVKNVDGVFQFQKMTGEITSKVVQQRFEEPGRMVFTCHMVSVPKRLDGQALRGLLMRYRIWNVVERGPNDSSVLHTYIVATPEVVEVLPDHHVMMGVLTNFILTMVDRFLDSDIRYMENQLLGN